MEAPNEFPLHAFVKLKHNTNEIEARIVHITSPNTVHIKVIQTEQIVKNVPTDQLQRVNHQCRFCFDDEPEGLIAPCACQGGIKYVHLECLKRWQRTIIINEQTQSYYYENDNRMDICNICKTPYEVPAPTREEMLRSYTGNAIQEMIKVGSLIHSTRENSDQMEQVYFQASHIPSINDYLHWIRGVFLIISCHQGEHVIGVNLTRNITLSRLEEGQLERFQRGKNFGRTKLVHFRGGPCPAECGPNALVYIESDFFHYFNFDPFCKVVVQGDGKVVWGPVVLVAPEVQRVGELLQRTIQVNVYWGEAVWGHNQFLGEVARGDWGMAPSECADAFPADGNFRGLWHAIERDRSPIVAPRNEMHDAHQAEPQRPETPPEEIIRLREELKERLLSQMRSFGQNEGHGSGTSICSNGPE